MKIEALESIKSDGYVLDSGDIKQNVPNNIGTVWVQAGWAKDLDGIVETGERQVLNAKLSVNSGRFVTQSTDVGV